MKNLLNTLSIAVFSCVLALGSAGSACAYSYAEAGNEPLIDNRGNLLNAAVNGDWDTVGVLYDKIKAEIDYLDRNDSPGLRKVFSHALQTHGADALNHAFMRAYAGEIQRRINAAADNIAAYQTAKVLVVKARRFYQELAGDLDPRARVALEDALRRALDALGNPGLFGYGRKPHDTNAFNQARDDIFLAIGGLLMTPNTK